MELSIVKKDITEFNEEIAFCQCISADAAMGAGVAVAFNKKFPDMKLKAKLKLRFTPIQDRVGSVSIYNNKERNQTVYNMITKLHYWDKALTMPEGEYLNNLRNCLKFVRDDMVQKNKKILAMPKIGCGLDRFNWKDVENIIKEVFDGTNIKIIICILCGSALRTA